jgi:hypothetical protein
MRLRIRLMNRVHAVLADRGISARSSLWTTPGRTWLAALDLPPIPGRSSKTVCLWQLDRIALGTSGWLAVACAQLAGNAVGRFGRFVAGAPTPFTVEMLRRAGVDTGEAAAAFSASTGPQLATTAALPLLALPAIIGGTPVSHSLVAAAYLCRHCTNRLWPALSAQGWTMWLVGEHALALQPT